MGTDCLNGLAFAYVYDINPESTLERYQFVFRHECWKNISELEWLVAVAYVHDITPDPLQILQKCMGRQWSDENCFQLGLQIKVRPEVEITLQR